MNAPHPFGPPPSSPTTLCACRRCCRTSTGRASKRLRDELLDCWKTGRQVFLCGNGGSAGNAIHLANDFLYGISKTCGSGLRVHALPANASVLTCLGNDEATTRSSRCSSRCRRARATC